MRKLIKLLLLIIWASLIFYFSHQVGDTSQQLSDEILGKSFFSFLNLENLKYDEFIIKYAYLFRKLAHLFEYFVLGILVYINLDEYIDNKATILSIIICLLYAISDEIHQLFIIGRSFGIKDIIIDLFGSLLGINLCLVINKKWKKDI